MSYLSIDFDLANVLAQCEAFENDLIESVRKAPALAAQAGVDEAERTKLYESRTGKLKGKVQNRRTYQRGASADMKWHAPYASFVDEGTRPHVIRGAPRLVFFWPRVGAVVAFARVNHPGTRRTGFSTVAHDTAEATLIRLCNEAVDRASARAGMVF